MLSAGAGPYFGRQSKSIVSAVQNPGWPGFSRRKAVSQHSFFALCTFGFDGRIFCFCENAARKTGPQQSAIWRESQGASQYHHLIEGARVLVIGSINPWVEAYMLAYGARETVTLEYQRIKSAHRQMKTMIPAEFRRQYLSGELGTFDLVATFSSLEHSGLGRFGDGLNPWGDILATARAWCVIKPGGHMLYAVPQVGSGHSFPNTSTDVVVWNAARYYGEVRFP